ncbi:MAG: TetR/AcrR family transcriptional regulator [Sphingomonadales bacterium]|nr:TetR/AcrR family transcriptional regulator [Sphingomonadales bacterium]
MTDQTPPPAKRAKAAPKVTRKRAYLPAAERRRLIVEAAQEVFARSNLQGARTRDIAAAASVNQATVFEHFESKEALFHAAVVQPLIDVMRGMHERVSQYETAASPDELGAMAHGSALANLAEMVEILPLMTAALFSDQELGRKLYREHLAPLLRQRGEVLAPLTRDGVDPQMVGLANFGMMFAFALDKRFGDRETSLEDMATQLNRLSTGGFARGASKD